MITVYAGRKCKVSPWSAEHPARGRLAEVIVIGPTGTLAADMCRIRVLEMERQWETVVSRNDLLPLTEKQQALMEAHGMPNEFADAVFNAIGEISVAEARDAIAKYAREFYAA